MLNSHTKNTDFILTILPSVINLITPLYSTQFTGHSSGCGFRWNEVKTAFWTYISAKLGFWPLRNSLEVEYDFWLSLEMECAVFYFQAKMNWTLNVN
ncbi:hypothetical protein GLOIN_2v1842516 [Rhizophagus irregularis DAOM 181602=DAOM 197198]|nr:hypothetical protein GLOIN_2v1842516 [Rhizophagus irregularis DAOM 181602=DAOM 197198]